jgi:hypothetical protein
MSGPVFLFQIFIIAPLPLPKDMLYFHAYLFTWLVSHAMFLRHHYKILVIIDTDCIYVVVHTIMTTTTPVYHADNNFCSY